MKVGDIVLYRDVRWKVITHTRDLRICQLLAFDDRKVEVPDDLDLATTPSEPLKVLFNPAEQWPFIAAPINSRFGRLKSISRGAVGLRVLEDWVPSDFLRPGGSIFFNPALRLRQGEVLVGLHENGARSRIAVTASFGTIKRRKRLQRNPAKVPGPLSSLDRLMGSDILDED